MPIQFSPLNLTWSRHGSNLPLGKSASCQMSASILIP